MQFDRPETIAPHEPEDFAGFMIGAAFPLGGGISDRLAIGFAAYVPTANLARGEVIDPVVPQFTRYQNLPDKFVVLAALAGRITDWLSVGGGVQVLAALEGGLDLEIELANRRVTSQAIGVDVPLVASPTAGLRGLGITFILAGLMSLGFASFARMAAL